MTGVSETMLIPLYARAKESRREQPNFVDQVAVKVIDSVDYDFAQYKNPMNIYGCQARTIILDREVKRYIKAHPVCTVINLACGLDDRFSRVDNQTINWYNIDLDHIIDLRKQFVAANDRVTDIACSALDYQWMDEVNAADDVLIISEGFLMYLEAAEVKELMEKIAARFSRVTLLIELMSQWMVEHQKMHEVTKKTTAKFQWGVENSSDFCDLCPMYRMEEEYNLTPVMRQYAKLFITLISWWLTPKNNRIGKFVKRV